MRFSRAIAWFGLLLSAIGVWAQSKPTADLIVTNANVWTVDSKLPRAQAVAIIGERIVAVGSQADVQGWRGASTRVIDAGGKLVLPGFNDAHVHFVSGGQQLDAVDLNDATSAEEFVKRVAQQASRLRRSSGSPAAIGMKRNGRQHSCPRRR